MTKTNTAAAKPANAATAAAKPADTKAGNPAPAPAEQPAPEPKPDPFANVPLIKLADTSDVKDLSGADTTQPYKYATVHADAVANKFPMMRNWKHSRAMFTPGTNKGGESGFKPASVYGTIADIAAKAGRAGISAHEMVTQLRIRQIGNKRSKYCEKLPPVGWAEGWLNSAVTKNIVGIHASKQAPAIFPVAAPGAEATKGEEKAAKQAADKGTKGAETAAKAAAAGDKEGTKPNAKDDAKADTKSATKAA